MKSSYLRKKNKKQLLEELVVAKKTILTLRIQKATNQTFNSDLYKKNRKTVARIKTILHEGSHND